jgi:hypothetical protein
LDVDSSQKITNYFLKNMITLNKKRKVCIYCPTEQFGKEIWDYLVSLGYKSSEGYKHRGHGLYTYIWVNQNDCDLISADYIDIAHDIMLGYDFVHQIKEYFQKNMITHNNINDEEKLSKVAIRVGSSPTLSKMVQELYFEKEIYWTGKHGVEMGEGGKGYGEELCFNSFDGYLQYSPQSFYARKGLKILDAATQMGEIVALFEKPLIKVPEIHGYRADYRKGDKHISFGCAQISIKMLLELNAILNIPLDAGNRTIQSVNLSSSKIINQQQINEILKYVEAVNSAE